MRCRGTLLGDDGDPVEAVEAFLAFFSGLERSPNTVRDRAMSLKLWFEFLNRVGVPFEQAGIDDVARFVSWLRAPADNVIVLDESAARRRQSTVNRHLTAVFSFYDHMARLGRCTLAEQLRSWGPRGRRGFKPFLHHATKREPMLTRPLRVRGELPSRPRTLTRDEIVAVIDACDHQRDKFLIVLFAETGMRIGQALGLRHGDVVSRERKIRIVPRTDNANGARAKTRRATEIPVSTGVVRLYSEYLHTEYGDLDSDYVFVNLWAQPLGRALTYDAVNKLVRKLRGRTGIDFTLHTLRHTAATDMIRSGVAIEVVSRLLTHGNSTVTSQTYVHLDVDDVRAELQRAGVLKGES
ncbi:MAG: tyrosine-type recombinase/integrase [Ilumatobacter sp.]